MTDMIYGRGLREELTHLSHKIMQAIAKAETVVSWRFGITLWTSKFQKPLYFPEKGKWAVPLIGTKTKRRTVCQGRRGLKFSIRTKKALTDRTSAALKRRFYFSKCERKARRQKRKGLL